MSLLPGVFIATKKDSTIYYRSSITYQNKHISLGSYPSELTAHIAFETANDILRLNKYVINDYTIGHVLSFEKWIILFNLRDNGFYLKTPIYMKERYFIYYMNQKCLLKFDTDDLFFYANHKIMKRGGYLFVSDFGMQINILSRYGIKNFAVNGKDYIFVNDDETDYRYGNIEIINPYYGVSKSQKKGKYIYTAKIHINGDYVIGHYTNEIEAAIAYNKAIQILKDKTIEKNYTENYITDLNDIEYAKVYHNIRISKKIREYGL